MLAIGFFADKPFASAQVSISLYPVSFKLALDPGDTFTGEVTVVNPNDFPLGVRPEKENLGGGVEGSITLIGEDREMPFGLSSWIYLDTAEFTLEPKGKKTVPFTITVPPDGTPGGHYAAVLFRGIPPKTGSGGQSGVGIAGRVGSVILVEVSGDIERAGGISSIEAPKFLSRGPLELAFKVQNSGNVHFYPEGRVEISGFLQKAELSWEPRVVFPGFDRTFKVQWDKKYLFGPIKATVFARLPEGLDLGIQSALIWAWPWQESAVALGVLLVLVLGIRLFKKKFKIVKVE